MSDEWYTPSKYIEAARQVMGGIDLDPASCALANETVKATHFYDVHEDGLTKLWRGRIFLNPPFGRVNGSGDSKIKMFTRKLVNGYKSGKIDQAILLSTVQTNSAWFQALWEYPLCFLSSRIHFNKLVNGKLEKESKNSHMFGTVFAYLGPNEQQFIEIFSQFGRVVRTVDATERSEVER